MTDRTVTEIQAAIKQLEAVAAVITEIRRRDAEQVGPDGFGNGGGDGRRAKGTHADPTHSAATSRKPADVVHEWTLDLNDQLEVVCKAAHRAHGLVYVIGQSVDAKTGRVNLVDCCPVCDDPMPQPRAGLDEKCFRRWVRAGRPERAPWINEERKRRLDPEQDVA